MTGVAPDRLSLSRQVAAGLQELVGRAGMPQPMEYDIRGYTKNWIFLVVRPTFKKQYASPYSATEHDFKQPEKMNGAKRKVWVHKGHKMIET